LSLRFAPPLISPLFPYTTLFRSQYFTVLPGIRSVGVMGDGRTYDYAVAIRAVTSIDGMTADFAKIPWEVLQKISVRIVNEVDHRSEEHTSELQSRFDLVCRLLLE